MTHPAFQALSLDDNADERAIKRAYARLLKDNRPDDNPAGFQKLNEAYQSALAYLKWRRDDEDAGDGVDQDAPGDSLPSPVASPPSPETPATTRRPLPHCKKTSRSMSRRSTTA